MGVVFVVTVPLAMLCTEYCCNVSIYGDVMYACHVTGSCDLVLDQPHGRCMLHGATLS